MTVDDQARLSAEEAFLTRQIAGLPVKAKLTRSSLESRLLAVKQKLAAMPAHKARRLELTFKGEPVEGSRAIEASFAGKAISSFSDAVAMVAAGFTALGLKPSGPVPGRIERRLHVVGPALGSFGFELELPIRSEDLFQGYLVDPEDQAVDVVLDLLEDALLGDEEALSDVLGQVELRAARKLGEFVKLTADRRAVFTLRSGARRIAPPDLEAARAGAIALRADDASQVDLAISVTLTGLRASKPDFECRREDSGQTLLGAIAPSVDLERLRKCLDQPVKLRFRQTTVSNARPRYLLIGFDDPDAGHSIAP